MRLLPTVLALSLSAPPLALGVHVAPARAEGPTDALAPHPKPRTKAEANRRYDEARKAYKADDFITAARAFDAAHAFFGDPTLLWNAGRAWERGGELEVARDRYRARLATPKLDEASRAETEEALARIEETLLARDVVVFEAPPPPPEPEPPPPPPPPPDRTVPLALMIGGGTLVVGGLVLGLLGESDLGAVEDAQASADGVVTSMTRAEALDLESRGTTLRTVGVVTGALGAAAAGVGLALWLLDDAPETDQHTGVTVTPTSSRGGLPDGLELGYTARF